LIGLPLVSYKYQAASDWLSSEKVAKNLQLSPANDKQGPAALNNYKHENVDHIHVDKVIK
jgi:hypothetical protein